MIVPLVGLVSIGIEYRILASARLSKSEQSWSPRVTVALTATDVYRGHFMAECKELSQCR